MRSGPFGVNHVVFTSQPLWVGQQMRFVYVSIENNFPCSMQQFDPTKRSLKQRFPLAEGMKDRGLIASIHWW